MMESARIECLSHLGCDQWLNGELADRAGLAAHVASCGRCAARLADHRRERAAFAVPLAIPRRVPRWAWGAAAAAALVCAWLVAARELAPPVETRIKGRPAIGFYVKHRDAIRRGGAGEVVHPGDALNFTASSTAPRYLAIISIDGAQAVSAYYPAGPVAAPLAAGRDQLLPLSVVLDDVLGPERVIGVFCERAVPVAQLEAAVARDAALPTGCTADALTIEKRAP